MAAVREALAIRYQVQTDANRLQQSRARVQSAELFISRDPVPNGLFNSSMGTTDMRYVCSSCGNYRRRCPGHPGRIELPFPVVQPLLISEIRRWLRVLCLSCGALMFDPRSHQRIARTPANKRLAVAVTVFNAEKAICPSCGQTHPKVIRALTDKFTFLLQYTVRGKEFEEVVLPFQIERLFARVSDEAVRSLGRDPAIAHPRFLIIRNLQVPPVSIRPAVRLQGPGGPGSSCHDINGILQYIIKASETIMGGGGPIALPGATEAIRPALADSMMNLQQLVYDLLIGGAKPMQRGGRRGTVSGARPIESIVRRFPRKTGRGRKNLAGKRVGSIGRDTISGLSQLPLENVGIPEEFARSLQIIETVQPENLAYLMKFFLNGRRRYPGASRVWRAATRSIHDVDALRGERLEAGDRLYRDMITGDMVCFNRQPSLERLAINVHKVVVLRDLYGDGQHQGPPRIKTFPFNVVDTPLYNADFDGDEMNMWPLSTPGGQAEGGYLAPVSKGLISTKNSVPSLGMVQDSTLGSALLSMEPLMDKLSAMALFIRGEITPDFSDLSGKDLITGREALSRLLRRYPINLERRPSWYSSTAEAYIKFDPEDIHTVIKHGELISGVLDKATVGGGARGGVFHQISRIYGANQAINCIFSMQQVAIAYLDQRGFTVSPADMMLPPEMDAEIQQITADMIREAELVTERLIRGEIIPPLGMTTQEFYERQQLEALKVPDLVFKPILSTIDPKTNGFIQMLATGSKGNFMNASNIMAFVGSITVNSERIIAGPTRRTLAYYQRGDMSPEASGFVKENYINGLSAASHYFASMNGRHDLTNKALSTAETGYANRKSVMATQSAVTDNVRMVLGPAIVQLLYGEDGMDARQLEPILFRSAELSDRELKSVFTLPPTCWSDNNNQQWHESEISRLREDRDAYREIYLTAEQIDFSYTFTARALSSVDVITTAKSIFIEPGPTLTGEALHELHLIVKDFCDDLPYLLLNSTQQRLRREVPAHLTAAVAHQQRLIRAELCSVRLFEFGATLPLLQAVLDAIRLRFLQSVVTPGEAVGVLASQAVSEPLTQYMLDSHHRSVSGGTNKSGIIRPQEIMGARPVEKEQSSEMLVRGLVPGLDGAMTITNDHALLQELADSIKLLNLDQLTAKWAILYEAFPSAAERSSGKPKDPEVFFPEYVPDWVWVDEAVRSNPLLPVPGNLTDWCFRFVLDRMRLVMKSITLETIVTRIRERYPNVYVLHTPEGATESTPEIVVRIYLTDGVFRRTASSKSADPEKTAREFFKNLTESPLRGLKGITDAKVIKLVRHRIVPSGENAGKLEREDSTHVIKTVGTNLHEALLHPRIDKNSLVTSSIGDTIKMFGIEAGRARIINEIRRVMGGKSPNVRHLQIYADQMTRTGVHTPFESNGIAKREPNNIMLGSLAHAPTVPFTRAILEGIVNEVYGIATPLMLGTIPHVGTGYVKLVCDGEFIANQRQSVMEILESL
jgi:DNA-directed RNA polymerase beta' subunit